MSDDRPIDVAVSKLGIDASARPEIQRAMDAIASKGDSGSPEGLVQMLRQAIDALRAARSSWTHAATENAKPMPPQEAEAAFSRAAHDARGRFEHELVRNADGETTRREAPPLPASSEPGRVVVTLVVAARRELRDASREDISKALEDVVAITPEDFVAMEVIWSPADEADRMSLAAMEERYPELRLLAKASA